MTVNSSASTQRKAPQPYFEDPCEVYARLSLLGDAVLLDSGGDAGRGRFDIIAAQPERAGGLYLPASISLPALREQLANWSRLAEQRSQLPPDTAPSALPFDGGYIGHLSYELGRRLQNLPAAAGTLPLAVARFYPWAVVQDRQLRQSWLVGDLSASTDLQARIERLLGTDPAVVDAPEFSLNGRFTGHWSLQDYAAVFERAQQYISAGDSYQINIAQRFSAGFRGELFAAYRILRKIARAPFSAYFPLEKNRALLCVSPERFLTVRDRQVETRPIKGTRPRDIDPARDRELAAELLQSTKERAENLMIVDLLRNDIGRFCEAGTVRADTLFSLESYATVHHLVSVVTGTLRRDSSVIELLLGCLPGGSITGAPKHRAMQIIDELETVSRQAWCGTIFYLSRDGRMDSNITIRTLYNEGDQLHCWAGGGLVHDSLVEHEFQEQMDKVGAFLHALEVGS
ncbi:MAG: para-aminobenzoate synthetase component 1 [Halieaceae bacterium]|jgi:para-aminobenzoate synthetase component 1